MKYGIKEIRRMYPFDIRDMCIRFNWYTRGTNEEYCRMLDHVASLVNVTTDDILDVAFDIMQHSKVQGEETLESFAFAVAETVVSTFQQIDENDFSELFA